MNKREIFIQRRAEGLSYEKISKEIGVSKPTLIKWGKKDDEMIRKAAKTIEKEYFEEVREQAAKRKARIKNLMNEVYNHLRETNYDSLTEKDLINLILKLEAKLKQYLDMQLGEEPDRITVNIYK